MIIARILAGAALLLLGRKLFWLFVGGVGFVFGALLATRLLQGQPDWVVLLIALVSGLLGAVLALFLQRLAIGIAGFLAGGYIAVSLVEALRLETGRFAWLPFIIGGLVGALLVGFLFNWALIILSSLTGSAVIAQATNLAPLLMLLVFGVLLAVGIVTQAALMYRERRTAGSQ